MSISPPIPEIQHFQNLTLKIHRQGHSSRSQSTYNTLLTHMPFIPCQSALPFLGYRYFKIWRWKFKVKVMSEVKVESHNMGPTFSQLTFLSFHVNWASHSWVNVFFQNLTLKIKGQVHGWGHSSKSQCGSNILLTYIPFVPFLRYIIFKIWLWKTMMLQKYRSRQFHRTLNGINPSCGFRDMGSTKSDPSAAWFDKLLAHGQALMVQMGK